MPVPDRWMVRGILAFLACLSGLGSRSHVSGRTVGFGVYQETGGNMMYYRALECTYSNLYLSSLYAAYNQMTASYTTRTGTSCCYKSASRNNCCLYNGNTGTSQCKCSPSETCGQGCQAGFHLYAGTTCVGVLQQRGTLDAAVQKCAALPGGGQIAKLNTQAYTDFVKTKLAGITSNIWIGLRRTATQFNWIGGVTEPLGAYNDWNTARPRTGLGMDCVIMDTTGSWKWNNVGCAGTNNFVLCQHPFS